MFKDYSSIDIGDPRGCVEIDIMRPCFAKVVACLKSPPYLRRMLADSESRLKSLEVELGRIEAWKTDAVSTAEKETPTGAS